MKEAIKHEYAKIRDELVGSVFCKRKICFSRAFFFFTLGRNAYFIPLLEISGCSEEAKLPQYKRTGVPKGHGPFSALPAASHRQLQMGRAMAAEATARSGFQG